MSCSHSLKTNLNPAMLYACSFQINNILWVMQEICPLYSILKPAVIAIFSFLRQCDAYTMIFFPLSCAVSWVKEKYFTCCVSGVEYEVYCVIFHYFSFPLTFLVMLSHRKVKRFHSCEGLWHLWDETSRTGISLSYSYLSGTGLDAQLWKECEYCSLTGTVAQKRQSHRNSGIITQQRSACSWTSVFSAWILSVQFCVL